MRRRSRDELLRRKEATRGGRRVLITCEGSKTEPNYFRELQKELRATGTRLEIVGGKDGPSPISVVDRAIELLDEAHRRQEEFDHAWCVIDRDGHESFDRAIDKAKGNDLNVAVSVPSFEVWLLLHFRYSTGPLGTASEAVKELRKHLPNYEKGGSYGNLLTPRRPDAITNGDRLLKHHVEAMSQPRCDPWTEVQLLVKLLESLRVS